MKNFNRAICGTLVLPAALVTMVSAAAYAASPILTTIHTFAGPPSDGAYPATGVTLGPNGVLYGVTVSGGTEACNCGTAFSLTPSGTGGSWTESVYSLTTLRGSQPYGNLIWGADHLLYGTAEFGGNDDSGGKYLSDGDAFQLRPPASPGEAWAEHDIYSFGGGTGGAYPQAGVTTDSSGVLYGTTSESPGTVYSLTPPASPGAAWTYKVLYTFGTNAFDGSAPVSGVTMGSQGVLYGTLTNGGLHGGGMVYSLTPPASPGGAWTEALLYSFPSLSGGGVGGSFARLAIRRRRRALRNDGVQWVLQRRDCLFTDSAGCSRGRLERGNSVRV